MNTRIATALAGAALLAGLVWVARAAPNAEVADQTAKPPAPSASPQAPGQPAGAQSPASRAQAPPAPAPPTAKPVPAELPAVLARVNDAPIDKASFERALKIAEAQAGRPVPPDRRDEILRAVLDQLIGVELLAQESSARKIEVTEQDIDAGMARIKQRFPNDAAFQQALTAQHATVDDVRKNTRRDIAISKVIEAEIMPKIVVTDPDCDAYYASNPDQFKQPEGVHARHILFKAAESDGQPAIQAAQAKAQAALTKVKGGADFAAVAKEESQDGSAGNGGDLGFFGRGQMAPPFEQAAFALKPGEISDIVRSQFGFHIIKVEERREARTLPIEEVRPRLKTFLVEQKRQGMTQAFVAGLRARARVEILM